jgi:hypothetical protein
MNYARGLGILIAAILALCSGSAEADAYKTAHGLYEDCAAPATLRNGAVSQQRERCADYLEGALNAWNLNQDYGICSRYIGSELPDAYVEYWQARGLGFLSGELRSAETSANEFLDSQKRTCPPPP